MRSGVRGDSFDKNIEKMKLIDEMIVDQTLLADRFANKYNRKFKGR